MTVYGYACVSRGRDDGTDTLQNQRIRLAGADVDAGHTYQDIITVSMASRDWATGAPESCTTCPKTGGNRQVEKRLNRSPASVVHTGAQMSNATINDAPALGEQARKRGCSRLDWTVAAPAM